MHLTDLVSILDPKQYRIVEDLEVADIKQDSRKVCKGDVFVAIQGSQIDGHKFISSVLPKQLSALIISSTESLKNIPTDVSFFLVKDTSKAWSVLAQAYYDFPSRKLSLIAVTGTTGKTTTAHIISQMLTNLDQKNMVIGTGGILIQNEPIKYTMKGPVTTPEPKELQYLLEIAVKEGCRYVVLEASSHGLDQDRLYGMEFDVSIFSTLAECHHISYHGSVDDYIQAKEKLFQITKQNGIVLLNKDTPLFSMLQLPNDRNTLTFSLKENADFTISIPTNKKEYGVVIESEFVRMEIPVTLPGSFQAYNFTAAALVANHFGYSTSAIQQALQKVHKIAGRHDFLKTTLPFRVLIDKANVPLALEYLKKEIQDEHFSTAILVFGNVGGGEREVRAYLGSFFSSFFDTLVLTTDDPETEDPSIGFSDFMSQMNEKEKQKLVVIPDRKEAINHALHLAKENSIVAILGRGNQKEFLEKGNTYLFDDIEETTKILRKMEKEQHED